MSSQKTKKASTDVNKEKLVSIKVYCVSCQFQWVENIAYGSLPSHFEFDCPKCHAVRDI